VSQIYFGIDSKSCETWDTGACGIYGSQLALITQGVHTFIAFSSDKAGNFSPAYSEELKIDFTPPVTKADLSGAKSGSVWTGPVKVELKAKDNVSGVEATYYSIDGSTRTYYTGPFKIATVGKHTLDFWSVDIAGNVERKNSDTFQIASSAIATMTGPGARTAKASIPPLAAKSFREPAGAKLSSRETPMTRVGVILANSKPSLPSSKPSRPLW